MKKNKKNNITMPSGSLRGSPGSLKYNQVDACDPMGMQVNVLDLLDKKINILGKVLKALMKTSEGEEIRALMLVDPDEDIRKFAQDLDSEDN